MKRLLPVLLFFCPAFCSITGAETPQKTLPVPNDVWSVITQRCMDCHDELTAAGGVVFEDLNQLPLSDRLDLLNKARNQVFSNLMPPEDAEQPTAAERELLDRWLRDELRKHNASELDRKLHYPAFGNYVDHNKLFSGKHAVPAFTPARRWLVSPQIFHERVIDVFQLSDRERDQYSRYGRTFFGVTNPFNLPEHSGVRYYDLDMLDGGHLLVMLDNAQWIAEKQLRAARVKQGEIDANHFPNPKDRWTPPGTPPAFETIILKDGTPTEDELVAAITTQFDLVLQREPTESELTKYLAMLRESIELGGNTAGLHQMLVAVLLESEFLYRIEFGAGPADEHGRKMLSPREAAYAISYALGDRNPDPQLVAAAAEGRLQTREDYHREVVRLLNDKDYYRGQIDPSLNGKHYQSNETSHPRIVRFFRDFFGYPAALKVFKDSARVEGIYRNPDRGTQGTPGWLTLEADRIVTHHVERDQHVFETLLTFEEFFVYDDKDDKKDQQIIAQWREAYEALKDSNWKTDPEGVFKEHEKLLSQQHLRVRGGSELVNYMHYFEESFGRGRTPFTTVPWAHGYTFHHAPLYSLPPTPSISRYGHWKSTNYRSDVEEREFWDYPVEQPFKVPHRKGILTHPAWLIAHSTNFHSNPVTRGRWIREKLLAGHVPDVPITVDAQVPEDPEKTFRQRVELVTKAQQCWKCHKQMNPLGLAFEMYDDFGRYRAEEALEHEENLIKRGDGKSTFDIYKTAPVVTTGELIGTENPSLEGEVTDALDLIDRLAKSERVRQSIIRHAFRFYLGRNETLADSKTLIDADRAYVESGGSFKAVIVSLLTSDSFIYRKDIEHYHD